MHIDQAPRRDIILHTVQRELRDDDGQAAALIVGLVGVLALIIIAIAIFGVHVRDLAQARTAADAAALAGAAAGRPAAARAATDNGGHLDSFTEIGTDVIVRVGVGTASATARAAIGHATLPTLGANGSDRYSG